jgi:hypothetical protein
MQVGIRDSPARPVTLTLSGPGGGTWILDPCDKLITVTAADADVPTAAAACFGSLHLFMRRRRARSHR